MPAKKIAAFNQCKSISTASQHGIEVEGLCLELSSTWCSLIDGQIDNQPGMNPQATLHRLQQLDTPDAIKLFTTEQQFQTQQDDEFVTVFKFEKMPSCT